MLFVKDLIKLKNIIFSLKICNQKRNMKFMMSVTTSSVKLKKFNSKEDKEVSMLI